MSTFKLLSTSNFHQVNPSDLSTDNYLKPKPLGSDVVGRVVSTNGSTVFNIGDIVWGDIGETVLQTTWQTTCSVAVLRLCNCASLVAIICELTPSSPLPTTICSLA